MTLMAGMDLPIRAIREQMASALDVIVHLARLRDGSRRITSISEVLGMEGETIVMQDIYTFDFGMGVGDEGRHLGRLKSTGIRPAFSERLADRRGQAGTRALRHRAVCAARRRTALRERAKHAHGDRKRVHRE